jgi:hypothetical protein
MGTIGKRRNKEEERKKEWKNDRKGLTLTGLLMEGTLTPWTERLTNFVLEFTAMTLNLEIHPEARRTSTVAA